MTENQQTILSILGEPRLCPLQISYKTQLPNRDVQTALRELVKRERIVEHIKGDERTYSRPAMTMGRKGVKNY